MGGVSPHRKCKPTTIPDSTINQKSQAQDRFFRAVEGWKEPNFAMLWRCDYVPQFAESFCLFSILRISPQINSALFPSP